MKASFFIILLDYLLKKWYNRGIENKRREEIEMTQTFDPEKGTDIQRFMYIEGTQIVAGINRWLKRCPDSVKCGNIEIWPSDATSKEVFNYLKSLDTIFETDQDVFTALTRDMQFDYVTFKDHFELWE